MEGMEGMEGHGKSRSAAAYAGDRWMETTGTAIVTLLSVVLFGLGWAHLELGRLLVEPLEVRLEVRAAAAAAQLADRVGGVGIGAENRYAGRQATPTRRRADR